MRTKPTKTKSTTVEKSACCSTLSRVDKMKLARDEHSSRLVARRPGGSLSKYLFISSLITFLAVSSIVSSQQVNSSSELNYENFGLTSIPKGSLCDQQNERSTTNLITFAHNQIRRLDPESFACVASNLRILILRNNLIDTIHEKAFVDLDRVQVLLLDDNHLALVPSVQTLAPLRSLRHLNLANNRIESLDDSSFGPASENLLSLNLKGNPLSQTSGNSLLALTKLTTLILSQTKLSAPLRPLNGLNELKYLHLDRLANLTSLDENLCQSSRKLATLVLKSNRLAEVPRLKHCQSLLLIDLSYNQIKGSLRAKTFANHPNLIDLYLGHNQLESIDELAFAGLSRVQVLELNNNQLEVIHQSAFLPFHSTLHDLNIAHNNRLEVLPAEGLDSLVSLRAYGNNKLRELPHFKRATSLALTYAYHCCDYGGEKATSTIESPETPTDSEQEAETRSLIERFAQFLNLKLQHILHKPEAEAEESSNEWDGQMIALSKQQQHKRANDSDTKSLNELILWPSTSGSAAASTQEARRKQARYLNQMWKRESGSGNLAEPRGDGNTEESDEQEMDLAALAAGSGYVDHHGGGGGGGGGGAHSRRGTNNVQQITEQEMRLIDELVDAVKQIRFSHLVPCRDVGLGNASADDAIRELIKLEVERNIRSSPRRRRHHERNPEQYKRQTLQAVAQILSGQQQAVRVKRAAGSSTSLPVVKCQPKPSAFLPCKDLFDTWWLRIGIWFVFVLAFCGNIIVIIVLSSVRPSSSTSALTSIMWLAHSKRHIDVPRFLVINLAVADLLMAIYLGLLAFVDLNTYGNFKSHAIKWQYSSGCKLAGFLGVLSSELSVFILAIITLERNYAITNAVHLNRRLSLQKAMIIMIFGYAFALTMAILPLNGIGDYRKFSICLPLDTESNLSSRLYVITLISMNTFSFVLLLSCYLRMYCAIRGSQAWNTNDLRIAKRMSILVIIDFLCWMPIIVVAVAFLFGHYIIGTDGMKVLTIFILPLNSVANPFLYAITTKKFKRDLNLLIRRMEHLVSRNKFDDRNHNFNIKEPNILAGGRQQYHHNMLLHKKRQKLLLANGGQDPARSAMPRRHAANKYRTPITANQVTLNRTTCSCQRLYQQQQVQIQVEVNHDNNESDMVMDDLQILNDHPMIVLDRADLVEEKLPSYNSNFAHHSGRAISREPSGTSCLLAASSPPTRGQLLFDSRFPFDSKLLRPRSADEDNKSKQPDAQLGPNLSCQAILIHRENLEPSQGLDVATGSLNPDFRSASACGYRDSEHSKGSQSKRGAMKEQHVAGSCDEPSKLLAARGSADKLARSISKLLLDPLARAWSSLQISLTNNANMATYDCHRNEFDPCDELAHLGDNEQTDNEDLVSVCPDCSPIFGDLKMEQETIDDILLMSSPDRRLLRANERRMSRSCDLVAATSQQSPFNDKTSAHSPSSSGNDHSQVDHHDDRRILLATINSIAGAGGARQPAGVTQPLNTKRYLRGRCTRCRSWSPALLGKLEDCIYQIRCRLPGLSLSNRGESTVDKDPQRKQNEDEMNIESDERTTELEQVNEDDNLSDDLTDPKFPDRQANPEDRSRSRGRFRLRKQQSSSNSDTMSTRTGRTVTTNMSESFDSITNNHTPVASYHCEALATIASEQSHHSEDNDKSQSQDRKQQ